MFCKKGVLKNFAHFTGNHLCQSLFFYRTPPVVAFELLIANQLTDFYMSVTFVEFLCCIKAVVLRYTAQKMKFSIKDFFSKCSQIRSFLENLIFCALLYEKSVLKISQSWQKSTGGEPFLEPATLLKRDFNVSQRVLWILSKRYFAEHLRVTYSGYI